MKQGTNSARAPPPFKILKLFNETINTKNVTTKAIEIFEIKKTTTNFIQNKSCNIVIIFKLFFLFTMDLS